MNRRSLLAGLSAGLVAPALMGSGMRALDVGSCRIRLEIGEGPLQVGAAELQTWVLDCCRAVARWYGRFPVHPLELSIRPGGGDGVYGGKTWGGEVPRIRVTVGARAELSALYGDWILVHELVHLAFPNVPSHQHWVEEGLSTYVEPWVRIGCGQLAAEKAWYDLVVGLPQGQPGPGDVGLDHTPTWGRTYWGGALWCLLVDLELRRSNPQVGLQQALIGILEAGGSMHRWWSLERALAAGDAAVNSDVLTRIWKAHRATAVEVALEPIWAELGVIREGRTVRFDDAAPGAAIRRAIDGTSGH